MVTHTQRLTCLSRTAFDTQSVECKICNVEDRLPVCVKSVNNLVQKHRGKKRTGSSPVIFQSFFSLFTRVRNHVKCILDRGWITWESVNLSEKKLCACSQSHSVNNHTHKKLTQREILDRERETNTHNQDITQRFSFRVDLWECLEDTEKKISVQYQMCDHWLK